MWIMRQLRSVSLEREPAQAHWQRRDQATTEPMHIPPPIEASTEVFVAKELLRI